jgi:thiosulfate reductase cytochrome b subunit
MPARQFDRDRLAEQADYEGTPALTGLANFAAAAGLMIGAYAVIGLAAEWHRSFVDKLPLIAILAAILVVNLTLQTIRSRRRRRQGLSRAWRRYLNGLGPRPPGSAPKVF